jgi:hypothetical protein
MSYNPANDFVGLWRAQTGGAVKGEMPGLDFVVAALGRAGIINVAFSPTAPTSNQAATAWFKTTSPSYQGEGSIYFWDANSSSYLLGTPATFARYLTTVAQTVWPMTGVPNTGPNNAIGVNGDWAFRTDQNGGIYGPKAGGFWPNNPIPGSSYGQFSSFLDVMGPQMGALTYRDASAWLPLQPGTKGQVLQTQGPAAIPVWASLSGGAIGSLALGNGTTANNPSGAAYTGTWASVSKFTAGGTDVYLMIRTA